MGSFSARKIATRHTIPKTHRVMVLLRRYVHVLKEVLSNLKAGAYFAGSISRPVSQVRVSNRNYKQTNSLVIIKPSNNSPVILVHSWFRVTIN